MAKVTKQKEKSKTNLTVVKGQVPANLEEAMEAAAGKGIDTTPRQIMPIAVPLQPLSPQCNKQNQAYIKGATAGSIWLRGATTPIVDGDDGILFQPVAWEERFVEWVPREKGGGFVAVHKEMPEKAVPKRDTKGGRNRPPRYYMPNGNEVIRTKCWYGFVVQEDETKPAMPYMVSFQSTGFAVYEYWQSLMNVKETKSGARAAAYNYIYRLRIKQRTNPMGTWYEFAPEDAFMIRNMEEFHRADQMFDDWKSNRLQAEAPDAVAEEEEGM
jgi:hypothetical protein